VFRGFFQGRYIFDSVVGFLHYASPATATTHGFGPNTAECANGTFVNQGEKCPDGFTATASPLLLYLQGAPTGLSSLTPGASDINNQKSVVRASWGIYNAQLNMLTQVGAITTNGVQQQTLFAGDVATCPLTPAPTNGTCPGVPAAYTQVFISPNGPKPQWPGIIPFTPPSGGAFPFQPGVTVFNRNYKNPRTYTANFGFQQ